MTLLSQKFVHTKRHKSKCCLLVCFEARTHAANFCRAQIKVMNLYHSIDASNEPSVIGNGIQEHLFVQPTTVMMTNADEKEYGPPGFDSTTHLVDVVSRVFGNCIERIVLNTWFHCSCSLEEIYWPHTRKTRKHKKRYVFWLTILLCTLTRAQLRLS